MATSALNSDTVTFWPRPECVRSISASKMPWASSMPEV